MNSAGACLRCGEIGPYTFVREQKETRLNALIEAEKPNPEETRRFVGNALRNGTLKTPGTDMDGLLPRSPALAEAGLKRSRQWSTS